MEELDDTYMDEEDIDGAAKPINQRTNTGNIKVAPEDSIAESDREMPEEVGNHISSFGRSSS